MSQSFVKVIVLSIFFSHLKGQDPVFSQYYLNQNYLNPAFAGFTNDLTTNLISRAQYLRIPGLLTSHALSANISCEEETRIGIGLIAYNHIEGEGFLTSNQLAGQLSANFPFKFRVSRRSKMNKGLFAGGIQLGMGQKQLNWSRLSFTDQYTPYLLGVQNQSAVGLQEHSSNIYLDASVGLRASLEMGSGEKPRFISFGFSIFHLNRPVQTFLESTLPLEPRYSAYFFSYFGNSKRGRTVDLRYWSIGALADYQQGLQSHTFSVYKDANEFFSAGLSLRRQNFLLIDQNVDAVINHLIYRIPNLKGDEFTIGVSYEWTVSSLGEEKTFGTIELGLSWRFSGYNLCKRRKRLCRVKGFDMGHDMPNIYL